MSVCVGVGDLRAKLVAFRDVAEDVFEQLDMAAGTETGMLSYNMVGDCSARLGDAIDAIDSAKDVKP
jgi:hypothetical protein